MKVRTVQATKYNKKMYLFGWLNVKWIECEININYANCVKNTTPSFPQGQIIPFGFFFSAVRVERNNNGPTVSNPSGSSLLLLSRVECDIWENGQAISLRIMTAVSRSPFGVFLFESLVNHNNNAPVAYLSRNRESPFGFVLFVAFAESNNKI